MAEKRMFSNKITQSDPFLSMPATSQNLYWHLSMDADDDGFVNRPKAIMRMVGASEDDLNILILKNFVIPFDVKNKEEITSMVCVIKHWFIHNNIRNDRKKNTTYVQQKNLLTINSNGAYSVITRALQPNDNQVATNGMHSVLECSVLECSEDKDRLTKPIVTKVTPASNNSSKSQSTKKSKSKKYGEYERVVLTEDQHKKLFEEYPNAGELITYLDEYCEMHGKKYKNYYLTIKKWVVKAVNEQKSSGGFGKINKDSVKHTVEQPVYNQSVYNDESNEVESEKIIEEFLKGTKDLRSEEETY
ncbi:replisome organizer [Erysipelothrix anatis]|uniref:replisome organizer n=1 Tax=Erysipelothrix anatis TaxID=2683713 RepID=UPI00135A8D3D|nr:replisome organizer [Erysipelothrix anatis]